MQTTVKKGQKVKFVVGSAQEAVNLIRDEMGPTAKVLSVRQVEGRGLAKFLSAPKLEIVATLPEDEAASSNTAVPPAAAIATTLSAEEKELLEAAATQAQPSYNPYGPTKETVNAKASPVGKLEGMLRAAGFESALIRRFQTSTDWQKLERVPLKTALNDLARRLRLDYDAISVPAVTQSIAFIGPSGVGKTTALCKQLAHEVFFERRSVQVLKLDVGVPNADTALALYCEVMGVALIRDIRAIQPTAALLVDTSGVSLSNPEEVRALKQKLDELGVKTRAWVVNAAYDNAVIDKSLAAAEDLGATHTIYTHLDELVSTTRLWQFVLSGRMPALFGSVGPGVAHDRAADIGDILLQKTFPDYLLK